MALAVQPRQYQVEAWHSIFRYFEENGGNPLVAMPTATGKSVVIAEFLRNLYQWYPTERVLVLTHAKELIQQDFNKLLDVWPTAPAGIYSAGLKRRDTFQKILFCGIRSVAKRAAEFGKVALVLIDEAHLVGQEEMTQYRQFIDALKLANPLVKVIGFTATPWRLGVGKLTDGGLFTDFCFDITDMESFNRLFDEGYLCRLVPKPTVTELPTDGVHTRGGEYIEGELQAAVNKQDINEAAVLETISLASDRYSWLTFCAGVDHTIAVRDMMLSKGVSCRAVHSRMKDSERDRNIEDWKAGKYTCITNNGILTTGIDHPALDLIVMLRPTKSTPLWVQMLGRGTRPYFAPGFNLNTIEGRLAAIAASHKPNCLVLDFAKNTESLGPINDPLLPRKKGEKTGEAPVKLCETCNTYNHASARVCFVCGTEFPFRGPAITKTASTAELIRTTVVSQGEAKIQEFKVTHITYSRHTKLNKPASLKVSYYCGYKMFQEFVCLEHTDGLSKHKSRDWWRARTLVEPQPATVDDALCVVDKLAVPTHIRVRTDEKYPTILSACFDGSAFGTREPDAARPDTAIDRSGSRGRAQVRQNFADMDDDIPF